MIKKWKNVLTKVDATKSLIETQAAKSLIKSQKKLKSLSLTHSPKIRSTQTVPSSLESMVLQKSINLASL